MRIRRAIANLCDNAQNNLRIFANGKQKIPIAAGGSSSSSGSSGGDDDDDDDDRGGEEEDDREKLLSDGSDYDTMMNNLALQYYHSSNDGSSGDDDNSLVSSQTMTTTTTTTKERATTKKETTFLTMIINIVTTILDRESDLLSNVLLIQQLDIIDGDGAVLIYDRLVYLCNGSYDTADGLLDDAAILPAYDFMPTATTTTTTTTTEDGNYNNNNNTTTTQQCGINASPYALPECNNLDELLNAILQFQSLLHEQQQQQQQEMDVTVMIDTYHSKCIELVNGLTKEACIYLLTNWLLSSALCDISFFVTFQLLTVDCNVNEVRQSCDTGGIALCNPLEKREKDGSGSTDHTTTTTTGTVPVYYEVKVVDCDPKPARKLRERKHVESKFHLIDEKMMI
jgi:hypothetical protein